jgi:peroxiredoxin
MLTTEVPVTRREVVQLLLTRYGRPVQLNKEPLAVNAQLPLCRLYTAAGVPFYTNSIHEWSVLSMMPTIARQVCDTNLLAFHQFMARFNRIKLYTIVLAEPTALQNWCGLLANHEMTMLADSQGDFGLKMGLLINSSATLARSIYIVDPGRVIRYRDVVREQSNLPNFHAVIQFFSDH